MRKNLLVLSSVYPYVQKNTEAANVVAHEIVRWLANSGHFEVAYSCVAFEKRVPPPQARKDLDALIGMGVSFLDPIVLEQPVGSSWFTKLMQIIQGNSGSLIRGAGQHKAVLRMLGDYKPDAILTIWSEVATAATAQMPVPKIAYYGNPDHKVLDARLRFEWEARKYSRSVSLFCFPMVRPVVVSAVRRAHLNVMATQAAIGDVAKNDADYYQSCGLLQAFYIRNIWPTSIPEDYDALRSQPEQTSPFKIIGSVGNLGATGNIHGIRTIAVEILPRLRKMLGEGAFEIHIFGGGAPHPSLNDLLTDQHIRLRGFVNDLDAEMRDAPVFLVANNSSRFVVGHTRFLHAWSMGCCVVGFAASAEAMPELRHRKNALLGKTPDEVTAHIVECYKDSGLRREIGIGGLKTLASDFNPEAVTKQLIDRIRVAI